MVLIGGHLNEYPDRIGSHHSCPIRRMVGITSAGCRGHLVYPSNRSRNGNEGCKLYGQSSGIGNFHSHPGGHRPDLKEEETQHLFFFAIIIQHIFTTFMKGGQNSWLLLQRISMI